MKWIEIFLSLVSGAVLVLAFPKFQLEFLAWFGLVPLLWAIRRKSPVQAAVLGFLSGLVFHLGTLYWIYNVLTEFGHLPSALGVFFVILLSGYLALYFSAFAFAVRWVRAHADLPETLFAPFLWVALEYLRGWLFSGFPWELLGYSQYRLLPLVQISDITGVYGVSFLVVLANAALYRLAFFGSERTWGAALREVLAAAILIAGTALYGQWRMMELAATSAPEKPLRVALVQGNIRQDVKWEAAHQEDTIRIYSQLTLQARNHRPQLVIWPETAAPFFFQNPSNFQNRIFEVAQQMGVPLLLGAPAFDRQGDRILYYNSAFLVSPDKKILGRYDKLHLVPFGEYAPLSSVFNFTKDIIGAIGDFTEGAGVRTLPFAAGDFGVLICYEAIFPDLTRQFLAGGARFLVNITNDAWFGKTSAPYQHLSMVALRAIENRVPIARAANTGISALIDPTGEIRAASGLFTREVLSGTIQIGQAKTIYTQFGDAFAYACLGLTALGILMIRLRRGYRVERRKR
jgi:apolipoprotein N-acyltransferase